MRIACIVAVLAGAPGCAQLVGADDPVAEFEVSPRIDGQYLLALDATSTTVTLAIYRFMLDVDVDEDDRSLTATWIPLARTGPGEAGAAVAELDVELENALELDFEFDLTLDIPAAAADGTDDVRLIAEFSGKFPAIDGEQATTDAFCGTASGTVSLPADGSFDATFAAVRIEAGATPPEAADAFTDCADF